MQVGCGSMVVGSVPDGRHSLGASQGSLPCESRHGMTYPRTRDLSGSRQVQPLPTNARFGRAQLRRGVLQERPVARGGRRSL